MAGADRTNSVFVMWFVPAGDEYQDDAKFIGVYRTRNDCQLAIERLKGKAGFRDHVAGFGIHEHQLNKDNWPEGFISAEETLSSFDSAESSD